MVPSARFRLAALLAFFAVPGLAGTPQPCRAQIKEAPDDIVDIVTEGTLEKLPRLLPAIPAKLNSDRDVYLLMRGGAAVYDVRVLARPSVDPRRLAQALSSAASALYARPPVVEWSRGDAYSAATFAYSRSHFGMRTSRLGMPVGAIVACVRAQGFTPHASLRIPSYAIATGLALPYHQSQTGRYYLADQAAPAAVATLSTELSIGDICLAWFLILGTAICSTAGLLAAVVVAGRRTLDRETRSRLFTMLAMWPLLASLGLSTAIGFFYMSSDSGAKTADVWLGSTLRSSTAVFVLPNATVFAVIACIGLLVRFKLFPPQPLATRPELVAVDTRARAVKHRTMLIGLIPFGIGLAGYLCIWKFVPHKSALSLPYSMGALALMHLGPLAVFWRYRRQVQEAEGDVNDAGLTRHAERIGQELKVRVAGVRLGRGESARRYASVEYELGGNITVSQKAVEVMSPLELEYVIAYSLAVNARVLRSLLVSSAAILPGPLLLVALLSGAVRLNPHYKLPVIFVIMVGMFGLAGLLAIWSARRLRVGAMKRAIDATSDLATARSAHNKLIEFGAAAEGEAGKIGRMQRQEEALLSTAAAEISAM